MSVLDSIKDLQNSISSRDIALTDGFLEAMKLLRTKLPEAVNVWLNRELTGYDASELNSFDYVDVNYFNIRCVKNGIWCEEPTPGVFVQKNVSSDFLIITLGVQTLEAELWPYLHLEELACGDSFPNELRQHVIMVGLVDRPSLYICCHVKDLLRVYAGLRAMLLNLLQTVAESYYGPALIYR